MVTLPLERMASRVAASLCYATGLGPEMVVSSQKEYEVWLKLHLSLIILFQCERAGLLLMPSRHASVSHTV